MSGTRKVALVTGAARRIGAAIARDLARQGFSVAIHCNSARVEAESLARDIAAEGGEASVFAADLTDMRAASGLVPAVRRTLGPVGLLVNSASAFDDDSAQAPDWERWDRHFALHLKAPVLLAGQVAEGLEDGQPGLVVNIIDQRVWKLTPQFFSYTLSKSALWTATRTMAQSFAPRMRVNAIGPGPTLKNTRQRDSDFLAQVDGLLLKDAPLLTEFGSTIRYFWETPSVTGQMVAIDGGQHLAWRTADVTGMRE
jgi:NAD(P)-dependent dehydrogenase (short-subunit alcohol dehydrogenase family)